MNDQAAREAMGEREHMSTNKLTSNDVRKAKDILDRLELANLTPWETGFIETVTEQTGEAEPWLTRRQWEILTELDQEKGG